MRNKIVQLVRKNCVAFLGAIRYRNYIGRDGEDALWKMQTEMELGKFKALHEQKQCFVKQIQKVK